MQNLKEVVKKQNMLTANWLIHYWERKKNYDEKRQEFYSKGEKPAGLSTGLSKPTESIAVKLADHALSNEAKWLETVEVVDKMLGSKKRLLLHLRQECRFYAPSRGGRPGWIAPVQVRFGEVAGFVPAEQTLKNMWRSIIDLTIQIAFLKKCKF